jgi:monoamine oxidase
LLDKLGPEEAVRRFLKQLDEIFSSPDQPQPATSSYVKAHVYDWSKEQWVRGAYSYPSYGAEENDRAALAAPVDGTLFFAGGLHEGS